MGRRGPKPEPAAVKKAKGNSGRRPIGEDPKVEDAKQEVSVTSSVVPPTWLKDGGLDVWGRLAPRLIAMKLLTQLDAETFGRYCRNFSRWLKMQERLDDKGEVYEIETASGIVRRYEPAFAIADRLERQLSAAEANFGLNPAERQRLYAARAAGAGAGAGDLFDSGQRKGEDRPSAAQNAPAPARPTSAVGFLQ
ncbi:phage terminase small subunit P27 family [Rhizobium leguminosarum]|uniref:phage terminase small subunit P27 family n=1 Tax=Rhizobium leguminosarum TaxID=384 RepID=UPI0005B2F75F|nr:phage terminase small subunit P27 family [Rhizobium leguminosarum]